MKTLEADILRGKLGGGEAERNKSPNFCLVFKWLTFLINSR